MTDPCNLSRLIQGVLGRFEIFGRALTSNIEKSDTTAQSNIDTRGKKRFFKHTFF